MLKLEADVSPVLWKVGVGAVYQAIVVAPHLPGPGTTTAVSKCL